MKPGVHAGHGGTYNTCQHQDCVAYRRRYLKRWQYERAQGIKRLTTAAAARAHIDCLIGADWSMRSIAAAAGVSVTAVSKIAAGQAKVQRRIAEAIVNIDPDQVPSLASSQTTEPFVSKVGAVRRIQAMLAMGWTHQHIYDKCGVRSSLVMSQQGRWITRSTHDKIAAAYRELASKVGPSERTRGRARKLGYLTAAAWGDIDLDAVPEPEEDGLVEEEYLDEAAILRRMHGERVELSTAEAEELRRRWIVTGRSLAEMERTTGLNAHRYNSPEGEPA